METETLPMPETFIVRELIVKFKGKRKIRNVFVSNPENVYQFVRPYFKNETVELMIAVYLNTKNQIMGWALISRGSVSESIVHPREILKTAVLANASSLILVHNHPSQVLTPSLEDIAVTKRVDEACKIIGIPLLDHIIVSDSLFISLRDEGYL